MRKAFSRNAQLLNLSRGGLYLSLRFLQQLQLTRTRVALLEMLDEVLMHPGSRCVSLASGIKPDFGTMTKPFHVGHCAPRLAGCIAGRAWFHRQ